MCILFSIVIRMNFDNQSTIYISKCPPDAILICLMSEKKFICEVCQVCLRLTLFMLGNFSCVLLSSSDFFKIIFFLNFFEKHHLCVKRFGLRPGLTRKTNQTSNDKKGIYLYTASCPHRHYRQGCTLYTLSCKIKAYKNHR